jgi:hypothetical protein
MNPIFYSVLSFLNFLSYYQTILYLFNLEIHFPKKSYFLFDISSLLDKIKLLQGLANSFTYFLLRFYFYYQLILFNFVLFLIYASILYYLPMGNFFSFMIYSIY